MTDEKLIEEAAKAIYEAGVKRDFEFADWWEIEQAELEARAALAVFEKARTPTDDEREYERGCEPLLRSAWHATPAVTSRRTVQGEPTAHRFEGESDPIATNPILRGVDLALERLVRRDCFTERTMRILDELRAEVAAAAEEGKNRHE